MSDSKRTLSKMNAEVDYLLYLLNATNLMKGEEGLRNRLMFLEKEMLDKGGMHMRVNETSATTHAAKDGKAMCGAQPLCSYMRVGIKPTCKRCMSLLGLQTEGKKN